MRAILCPACEQSNDEFNARCSACGAVLPASSDAGIGRTEIAHRDPEAAGDPLLGMRVGHFKILHRLGRGGMGVVYKAVDLELGREVALKFLDPGRTPSPYEEERFRREAQATASLDHPNVGTLYEVGEHGGRRFLAMAFYEGETLGARLARAPQLPLSAAASICGQLAAALAAAHAVGLVHRDLKPENVMLLPDGRVKLLDFGLARSADSPPLTELGIAVGTAAYMAPEQLRGETPGPEVDLWALGVVLYEMLAGRRPFGGERPGMVHAILKEEPQPVRELRPDVPPVLERIVARCLAKAPADRTIGAGGAAALVADLREAELLDSTASRRIEVHRPATRRRWLLGAAVLLALGLGALLWRLRAPAPPLHVAVLRPQVQGLADAADRVALEENLRSALLRALTALDGVAPIDPAQLKGLTGGGAQIALATGAQEALAAEALCSGELCQVTLRRLRGGNGTVLREEGLEVLRSNARLSADMTAAALRRTYAERRLRASSSLALQIEEADYDRYLALLQRMRNQEAPDEEILRQLAELRRRTPGFLEVYGLECRLARSLYERTKDARILEQGLDAARRAQELAPGDPLPVASRFDLALAAGRLDEAGRSLRELARIDPIASEVLLRQARLADRRGRSAEAVELMKALIRERPALDFLLTLANMEYRLGRLSEARGHVQEALARFPDQPKAISTAAQIELLNGDPQRAIELLTPLLRRSPGITTLGNLGSAYLLTRQYGQAEAVLRRAHQLFPADPQISLNLADSLELLGRREAARALYREVAAALADRGTLTDWPRLSVKAQALAHLGERQRAIEILEQALRLTPDNPQLHLEAAVVYAVIADSNSALFHARKALHGGVQPVWFRFPWLDPLRSDPELARLSPAPAPAPAK